MMNAEQIAQAARDTAVGIRLSAMSAGATDLALATLEQQATQWDMFAALILSQDAA